MILVDDPDHPGLAAYQALRGKESTEHLYAEGPNVIARLLTSTLTVRSILLSPAVRDRLGDQLDGIDAPVFVAQRSTIAAIVGFDLHRGAIAVAERPEPSTLEDVLGSARRLVVLEDVNDHENLGAIARSARALGADALVLSPTCADPFYRRSIRVSMGELFHLRVVRCNDWPAPLDAIAGAGFDVWALSPNELAVPLPTIARPAPQRLAIVAGAEGPGLSEATLARFTNVAIPMHHGVDSINVGHAIAVALALSSS